MESGPAVLKLRYLYLAHGNKSAALNAAMETLGDCLIFFTDDDVRVDPGVLTAYAEAAAARGPGHFRRTRWGRLRCSPAALAAELSAGVGHGVGGRGGEFLRSIARISWLQLGGVFLRCARGGWIQSQSRSGRLVREHRAGERYAAASCRPGRSQCLRAGGARLALCAARSLLAAVGDRARLSPWDRGGNEAGAFEIAFSGAFATPRSAAKAGGHREIDSVVYVSTREGEIPAALPAQF